MLKRFFLVIIFFTSISMLSFFYIKNLKNDNFYYKLKNHYDVSILVAGDSIGNGVGASKVDLGFSIILKSYLEKKYKVKVNLKNTSMGGNGTYAEYVRVSKLKKENFDLIIICCGQNDNIQSIGRYYEALIRTIRSKWPKAEIISVLQSSQRDYTKLIQTIKTLDEHYGIVVADTIAPFINGKNGQYISLAPDGTHPNDKGYALYAEILENLIDEGVMKKRKVQDHKKMTEPVFKEALEYSYFLEVPTNILLRSNNDFFYQIDIPDNTHIGIDFNVLKGSNYYEFVINNIALFTKDFYREWKTQQQILDLTEYYNLRQSGNVEIKLKFKYTEQADSLKGFFISSPSPILFNTTLK